jgi:hypothetical protein
MSDLNYNKIRKHISITHEGCICINSAKYAETDATYEIMKYIHVIKREINRKRELKSRPQTHKLDIALINLVHKLIGWTSL